MDKQLNLDNVSVALMIISTTKPRLLYYTVTVLIIAVAALIFKLSTVISGSNLIFLIVAVVLSAIMLYKLSFSGGIYSSRSDIDDADQKNMRLALNFQGQGKLDAAYALFKQCRNSKEKMTIGRKPDNDICINNLAISSYHTQIITVLDSSFLEDLNSTNGTYVNARLVKQHALEDGDLIDIGNYRIRYVGNEPK